MGGLLCKKLKIRTIILGLDGSGKTTWLQNLRPDETVRAYSLLNIDNIRYEIVRYRNVEFAMRDILGSKMLRHVWQHVVDDCQAVIYVIDASNHMRLREAREHLMKLMSHQVFDKVPLLILANKQDLPRCLTAEELEEFLGLGPMAGPMAHRNCIVQATSGIQLDGSRDTLDWLVSTVSALHAAGRLTTSSL